MNEVDEWLALQDNLPRKYISCTVALYPCRARALEMEYGVHVIEVQTCDGFLLTLLVMQYAHMLPMTQLLWRASGSLRNSPCDTCDLHIA